MPTELDPAVLEHSRGADTETGAPVRADAGGCWAALGETQLTWGLEPNRCSEGQLKALAAGPVLREPPRVQCRGMTIHNRQVWGCKPVPSTESQEWILLPGQHFWRQVIWAHDRLP